MDFIGPVGTTFARQAQIRYTAPTANGDWSFSLENPETTLTPFGGGPRIDADDGRFPDAVLRRNWTGDWGNVSVAAMARELRIGRDGFDDSAFGGAIGVAGKHQLGDDDDLRWQMNLAMGSAVTSVLTPSTSAPSTPMARSNSHLSLVCSRPTSPLE